MIKKDYQLLVALLQELNTHQEVLLNGVYRQTFEDFEQDDLLFPALCERIRQDCIAVIRAGVVGVNPTQCLLTAIPPVERHPYLNAYPVNPAYRKYVIGTFPPISYLCDLLNLTHLIHAGGRFTKPKVPFYHGNRLSLWKVLNIPGLDNNINRNVRVETIQNFLTANSINYFDVIKYCQRQMYNPNDTDLYNIIPNEEAITTLLNNVPDKLLVFNTGSTITQAGLNINTDNGEIVIPQEAHALDIFIDVLQRLGYNLSISLNGQEWLQLNAVDAIQINAEFHYKLIFYLKINNTIFTVVAGPSPSARNYNGNPILNNFIEGGFGNNLTELKRYVYQNALIHNNLHLLFELNG